MTGIDSITIQINGQAQQVASSATVCQVLELLGITNPAVAVEINSNIVSRNEFGKIRFQAGDVVEIVTLVGGG